MKKDAGAKDAVLADKTPGAPCTLHQDCTNGEYCGANQCIARCDNDNACGAGNHCDPNAKECRSGAVDQTPNAKVVRQDFKDTTFYLNEEENDDRHIWYDVTIPANTISWTLAAELTDAVGCQLSLLRIEDASGKQIFPLPTGRSPDIGLETSGPNFAAIQLPHTPLASIAAGNYRARFAFRQPEPNTNNLCGENEYKGRVISLIKTADAFPTKGTLDVNIYIVGLEGITPENAATNTKFQNMFAIFRKSFVGLGVTIGKLNYVALTQEQQDSFAVIDNDAETQALFALSKGQTNQAVNLFFVRSFRDGMSLGLAGAIPGPSTIHGTKASGVAISAENIDTQAQAQAVAETTAHELGHYLGLFHLSEMEGTVFDPLPDTPECGIAQNTDGEAGITADECVGFGAEYVMFYEPAQSIKQEKYSPNQRFVVYMNPAIR